MKTFDVLLSENVQKQLYEMDKKLAENIKSSLKELETDPFRNRARADIKKLKGSRNPPMYRLRIGSYRAIYAVIGNDVKVTEIIKRGKGYEWLE